jgi:glycogen operon protein
VDDTFCVLFNAHWEPLEMRTPPAEWGKEWTVALDTARLEEGGPRIVAAGEVVLVEARSLVVLRAPSGDAVSGTSSRGK